MLTRISTRTIFLLCLLTNSGCFTFVHVFDSASHAEQAQELREAKKFEEAIEQYKKHIQVRLERKQRDENPYFYYLLIGDCQVELEQIDDAETSYLKALEHKVDEALVAERLRRLGTWYSERVEFEKGIDLLQRHRHLDPLLYDLEIDRLHKLLVASEIKEESSSE